MNILPKKRWHVRTKENIARVRKDEAEAAAKEREEQKRIEQADREARLNLLKLKSRQAKPELQIPEQSSKKEVAESKLTDDHGHVNLFADFENAIKKTNVEHDRETKEKTEEYEKKIGYLTYLGQDTNEALGKKNWYEVLPESSRFSRSSEIKVTYDKLVLKNIDGTEKKCKPDEKDGEIDFKIKQRHDPIHLFNKCSKSKSKGDNNIKTKCKTVKVDNKLTKIQRLREARLKREQQERQKTVAFLTGLHGGPSKPTEVPPPPKIKPKYNSQFNPDLAKQNYY